MIKQMNVTAAFMIRCLYPNQYDSIPDLLGGICGQCNEGRGVMPINNELQTNPEIGA